MEVDGDLHNTLEENGYKSISVNDKVRNYFLLYLGYRMVIISLVEYNIYKKDLGLRRLI